MLHKIIIVLILGVLSNYAMAEWTQVDVGEEASVYTDLSTVSKSGNTVKVWDVTDLKKKSAGDNYLSSKSQHEYDCKEKKSRILSYSTYSGNMATGNVIYTSSFVRDWLPVKSGGLVEDLWNKACNKH
jgi:hypothetical protein